MNASLYVHIPFCLKKCGYCDFFSVERNSVPHEYAAALANQMKWLSRFFCVEEWKSVYIGGGTPSLIAPQDLSFLCKKIAEAAPLSAGYEWTIEANPGTLSRDFLQAAKDGGINRLSLGIQSADERVLRAAGRLSDAARIEEALRLAKDEWSGSLSVDLIAGLPFQTREILERDIALAKESGARHVSLYSLTLEEGTPLKKAIESRALPYDEEEAEALWLYGRDALEKEGYRQYEVSNFALPGFESRHNQSYWFQESYLGAGAGATGTIYKNARGNRPQAKDAPREQKGLADKNAAADKDFWKSLNANGQDEAALRYTNILDAAEYARWWNEDWPDGADNQDAGGENRTQKQNADARKGLDGQDAGGRNRTQKQNADARKGLDGQDAPNKNSLKAKDAPQALNKNCLQGQDAPRGENARRAQDVRDDQIFLQAKDCAALAFPCQTERLDLATQEFEYLMLSLRTARGASEREYKERFGGDLCARLGLDKKASQGKDADARKGLDGQDAPREKWIQKVERSGETFYAMTREGLLFLNRFLEEL